jgi:hypothetical protein
MNEDLSLADYFAKIFKENRWGNDESVSGSGSSLGSPSVRDSVLFLDGVIRRFKIRSMLDVPCGDFYWMPLILGRFPRLEYTGFDIVPDLITWNLQRFPDRHFVISDATRDMLPQADLVFCKDLLLHLRNSDIISVLRNFKESGSRYLLTSSNSGSVNKELIVDEFGTYRDVNLAADPYNLPPPIWATNYLSLWSLDAIGPDLLDRMTP